jgi:hypothetical protein
LKPGEEQAASGCILITKVSYHIGQPRSCLNTGTRCTCISNTKKGIQSACCTAINTPHLSSSSSRTSVSSLTILATTGTRSPPHEIDPCYRTDRQTDRTLHTHLAARLQLVATSHRRNHIDLNQLQNDALHRSPTPIPPRRHCCHPRSRPRRIRPSRTSFRCRRRLPRLSTRRFRSGCGPCPQQRRPGRSETRHARYRMSERTEWEIGLKLKERAIFRYWQVQA